MGASRMRQSPLGQDYDLLPPPPKKRSSPRHAIAGNDDISDAAFVVIPSGPRRPLAGAGFGYVSDGAPEQVSPTFAAYMQCMTNSAEALLERLSDRAFAVLVALIFGVVFMVAGGVISLSGQGEPQRTAALEFSHVSLTPQDANGMRILVINGIIENNAGEHQDIPPIRADLFSEGRLAASVIIEPPAPVIGGRQSRGFAARVQHPGGKMPDLQLSFTPANAI